MKGSKGIYIILGLAGVAIAAWLIFGGNKSAAATTGDGTGTAAPNTGTWLSNFGSNPAGIGGNTFTSWQSWFNKRQADGWALNTSLFSA